MRKFFKTEQAFQLWLDILGVAGGFLLGHTLVTIGSYFLRVIGN